MTWSVDILSKYNDNETVETDLDLLNILTIRFTEIPGSILTL